MHVRRFHTLPLDRRQKQIHDHEWFKGEEENHHIGYGVAARSFYKDVLAGFNSKSIPPFIEQLENRLYYHCCDCGNLFNSEKKHKDDIIGYLSKKLDGIAKAFTITSGICIECNQEKNYNESFIK